MQVATGERITFSQIATSATGEIAASADRGARRA
jgi:hypothetical protein